jgi:tetratricopeptide (TPR) repeat protein
MLYLNTKRYQKAVELFGKAHALRPEREQPIFNAANALLRMGDCAGAVKSYLHAAERDQTDPAPWHNAGVAHLQMGDLRSAYRCFRRAIFLDSGYFASWANLASVCRELGLRRRALLCAVRAQALSPGDERVEKLISECRTG